MRFGLAVAAAVVVMAAPAVARACSCSREVDVVWPEDGANEIPLNTRLWVGGGFGFLFGEPVLDDPRLRVEGEELGVEVSLSRIFTALGELAVFTPAQPLAPNTRYELVGCFEGVCDTVVTHFTTGTAADHGAPPLPVETDRDGGATRVDRDSCGKDRWASVDVEAEGLVIVQLEEGSLDPATLSGETSFASFAGTIRFGIGGCFTGWPVGKRESAEVRYGAFDVAGNFSGWTEADSLRIGGCGCRSDAPGGVAWLTMGLLALGARRGRGRCAAIGGGR